MAYGKTEQTFHHLLICAASGTVRLNMMMATQLLIDTDVLIDYLRNYPEAVSYVEARQEHFLPQKATQHRI